MDRLDMRVSDAEREDLAESLRAALTEGRLDLTEYDDRVRLTYQAKTYRDLQQLTEDLPASPPAPVSASAPSAAPSTRSSSPGGGVAILSGLGVFVALAVLLTIATHGAVIGFWPLFVFGFWGLSRRRSDGYGRH